MMIYKFEEATHEALENYREEYRKSLVKLNKIFEDLYDTFCEQAESKNELNPMMHFYSRCKTVSSMEGKLNRDIENEDFSANDINDAVKIIDHLHDIAAARILCPNKNSIFEVVEALKREDKLSFITDKEKNMIGEPPNIGDFKEYSSKATEERGYRSYHLIAEMEGKCIEIQIRTYGMEFWGQIEHDMNYKHEVNTGISIPQQLKDELVKTSNQIDVIDNKLYRIYEMILMNDKLRKE